MSENIINLHDRMHFEPSSKDLGSASVILEKKDSIITMRHGSSKEVLLEFNAIHGDWDSIIEFLRTLDLGRTRP